MAEVWLAVDLTLDRRVAVKWLKPTLATDDVVAERFRREAIAAASLNHPNIVAVHDVFEQDGRQAVVMQLVDGKSLRQLLDSQNRLSPGLTCHIGACVADALDHAHGAGFVHRDVKPGNIMITPDGRVLLTDFGIAKGLDGAEGDLTNDNIMMGTAKYLSPEQVRGKKLDGRADLYSLGLVLYECLAGRVPFLGQTDADTALARLQRDPTDLARLRATLPAGLVSIIHQLLARNPAHRPESGAKAAAALRAAADEPPPQIDPTDTGQHPARKLRRAPSDYRGRAKDNERVKGHTPTGNPPVTETTTPGPAAAPPPPAPSIPGEPGATPPAPARPRDATPPLGTPQRGRPAKGLSHKRSTSLVVIGVLVAVGLAVGGVLWASIQFGSDESASSTTVLPDEPLTSDEPTDEVPAGPAVIRTITAFDPDGDGTENDDLAVEALAGNPSTAWTTVCYSSQFMGGKRGVGLVVSFEEPATAALSVDILSAPYQVQFFTSAKQQAPRSIDGWGIALSAEAGQSTGTVVSGTPNAPVRHALVLLNEIGSDSSCTSANPYRGTLNQISVVE